MRYTRISADCPLDLPWVPADLFTSNAAARGEGADGARHRRAGITCQNAGTFCGLFT
jgi:hypothetical protein